LFSTHDWEGWRVLITMHSYLRTQFRRYPSSEDIHLPYVVKRRQPMWAFLNHMFKPVFAILVNWQILVIYGTLINDSTRTLSFVNISFRNVLIYQDCQTWLRTCRWARNAHLRSQWVQTEKSHRNLIKSDWNQIVFTIFRLIWKTANGHRPFAVPNQSR